MIFIEIARVSYLHEQTASMQLSECISYLDNTNYVKILTKLLHVCDIIVSPVQALLPLSQSRTRRSVKWTTTTTLYLLLDHDNKSSERVTSTPSLSDQSRYREETSKQRHGCSRTNQHSSYNSECRGRIVPMSNLIQVIL